MLTICWYGLVVMTRDFESRNPSSTLGTSITFCFCLLKIHSSNHLSLLRFGPMPDGSARIPLRIFRTSERRLFVIVSISLDSIAA